MVNIKDLIIKENILIVNTFSKTGVLGGNKNYGLKELLNQKRNDHKTTDNFLSTSTIRYKQDCFDNVFKNPLGLILENGEIHYAKRGDGGDIGYEPGRTTINYLDNYPEIIKPKSVKDLENIIGPRDKNHNELLVLNPKYKGLFIWCNSKYEFTYDINYYIDFCKENKLFFYCINLDTDENIVSVDQIVPNSKRFTDIISLINEKFE